MENLSAIYQKRSLKRLVRWIHSLSGGLRQTGACATIIGGAFCDPNSKFAVVCTKARYSRHFIGSYWRSTNQASSFNACNVGTSFIVSNWYTIARLGFGKKCPRI